MGSKPKAKPDDPEQFARFVEAAKKADIDESGTAFDHALRTIIRPKPKKDNGGQN